MMRTIRAEWLKLRRSPMWPVFLILPVLPAVMGTFNYLGNLGILRQQWYDLWSQHTIFSADFFLPAMIGAYCSYLWWLENRNHNWNSAMTAPVPVFCLYFSKLLFAGAAVAAAQAETGILFFVSGKLAGVSGQVPPMLLRWLLLGTAAGVAVCAVQLFLSLVIRSFAVPVGIAFVGGIAGAIALSKGFGLWFPYSLMPMGMQSGNPSGNFTCGTGPFLLSCVSFLIVFSIASVLWLKKRDVRSE